MCSTGRSSSNYKGVTRDQLTGFLLGNEPRNTCPDDGDDKLITCVSILVFSSVGLTITIE